MPSFGAASKRHLATLDPQLQRLMNEAIKYVDFSITCGFRNQAEQDKAFAEGDSKVKWPDGMHNKNPSRAVDVAPYPLDYSDLKAFIYLNGFICGIAATMGIKVRSGVDWDGDLNIKEHSFLDAPHIELH